MKNALVLGMILFTNIALADVNERPVEACAAKIEEAIADELRIAKEQVSFEDFTAKSESTYELVYLSLLPGEHVYTVVGKASADLEILHSTTEMDFTDIQDCRVKSIRILGLK